MDVQMLLDEYGLSRETAAEYIDAITRYNQTQTAEEVSVSRDTINRYKRAFDQMTDRERTLLITSLTQAKLVEQSIDIGEE